MDTYSYFIKGKHIYFLVYKKYLNEIEYSDNLLNPIIDYLTYIGEDNNSIIYKHKLNKKIKRIHKVYEKYTKKLDNGYEQAISLYHALKEEDMVAHTIKNNNKGNIEWLLIYHNKNAKPNRYTRMTEKRRKFYKKYNIDVDKYFVIHKYKELNITLLKKIILDLFKENNNDHRRLI